jgi:hypothetical protein
MNDILRTGARRDGSAHPQLSFGHLGLLQRSGLAAVAIAVIWLVTLAVIG